MSEALEELFLFGEEKMEKALAQLAREFGTIRSGRANPAILDRVLVDYYGAPTPLRQMSQVTVQDGTTLVISPYDKTYPVRNRYGSYHQVDKQYGCVHLCRLR